MPQAVKGQCGEGLVLRAGRCVDFDAELAAREEAVGTVPNTDRGGSVPLPPNVTSTDKLTQMLEMEALR